MTIQRLGTTNDWHRERERQDRLRASPGSIKRTEDDIAIEEFDPARAPKASDLMRRKRQ